MNPALIDQPSSNAAPELMADAEWLIEIYEPRIKLQNIDLEAALAQSGHFNIKAETT
jgi:phage baseplate assembly protein W